MPLRQSLAEVGVLGSVGHRCEASRPRSLWALISRRVPRALRLHGQGAAWVTMGIGMTPENTERSCVYPCVF